MEQITDHSCAIGLEATDRCLWFDNQPAKIAKLAEKYPHGIRLHIASTVIQQPLDHQNCFMYALNIQANSVKRKTSDEIFPGAEFVRSLLVTAFKSKEISPSNSVDGDTVIYFDTAGKPTHAGTCHNSKVISKWGGYGNHVWEHGVFEVPDSYGSEISVFTPLSHGEALQAYLEWAS